MLSFEHAKLHRLYNGFRFYNDPKKPFMITYLSENSSFINDYNRLHLQKIDFKQVVVPTTKIPRTYPSTKDRKIYKDMGMFVANQNKLPSGKNIIFDISKYLYMVDNSYNITTYRQKYGRMIMNIVHDSFFHTPSNYQKILMYSIDIDKSFNSNYLNRKIYPFLESIHDNTFPYDYFILCVTSGENTYFRVLIKDREYYFNKIKQYIKSIKEIDVEVEKEKNDNQNKITNTIIKKIGKLNSDKDEIIKDVIQDFIEKNPDESEDLVGKDYNNISDSDAFDLVSIAILAKNNQNLNRSKAIVKNSNQSSKDKLKNIEKRFIDEILIPKGAVVDNDEIIYKNAKISEAVDNLSPSHIFEKRKRDFSENLEKDIKISFKSLESKDVPLKIVKLKINNSEEQNWKLNKTDTSIINIQLIDNNNNLHDVKIQVPKINKDGTFFINGKRKCLINQMIQLPIQFPKPFSSKFESSYSKFYIYSKHTKINYLQIFMGTFKLSLAAVMFYGFGFEKTLQKFDINYSTQEDKPDKNIPYVMKIDNLYYIFKNVDSELQREFIQSFMRDNWDNLTNENTDLFSKNYFSKFIIRDTGRVNSVYLIQNNIDNIVDGISQGILASKGQPVKLMDIMYWMSVNVVNGYTVRRNDLDNQRIRSSEIISHLLQKHIMTAHTKYKEQYLSGNTDAKFEMPETQLISEFGMAEIVANMEYANPIEEISVMTRVTPIGKNIGGIPDKGAITVPNRGVHQSYYGNIDPIDTPEGSGVGITQQLTIGAAISTTRGLFADNEKFTDKKQGASASPTASMVPFLQNNDGNRVMFACAQMKQVVPLKNPEPPIIQTGYESILTNDLSENFIKRSVCDGKVVNITEDDIIIKCNKTNKIEKISTRPVHLESGAGMNTLSEFKNVVKIGQSVKKNQRISEGGSVKDGFLAMGRTLCAAYMGYKGYNFEDGIVISDKLVKDKSLMSLHGIIVTVQIGPKDKILDIIRIGEETKHGDILLKKSIGDIDELLGLSDIDDEDTLLEFADGQMIKKSPGGRIADIEIYCNDDISRHPEYVQKLINRTNRMRKNPKKKYTDKHGTMKGTFIKIIINKEMNITHGDKITNRYGGKGIVSLIEKEENMPITPWGDTVDIILSPIGVINRMNVGQLLETSTGLVSKILAMNILKFKNNRSKIINLIKSVLQCLDKTDKQVLVTSIVSNLNVMSDTNFNQFIREMEEHTFFPIIIPPYKSPKISDIAKAFKILKISQSYQLELPEYKTKTMDKVAVGYLYYQKLEHIAKLKLHARSTGGVVSKTGQPTAGKKRGGGIRVGESDIYAFLSHNTPTVINELFGAMSDGAQAKNEELSNILMNGHTDYIHPKSSQVGDLLRCYFMAMMIEKG